MSLPLAYGIDETGEVPSGGPARFSLHLSNTSACPTTYLFGSPAYGFSVTRLDGTRVWHWDQEGPGTGAAATTFAPMEERTFEYSWDLRGDNGERLPDGAYYVQGYLIFGMRLGQPPEPHQASRRHLFFVGPRQPLTHWLSATLDLPKEAVAGGSIPMTVKITNTSNEPVELYHGFQPYDFAVKREDGSEVYRWSRWRVQPTMLQRTLLAPGQSLTYTETWDMRDQDCQPPKNIVGLPCSGEAAPSGRYRVEGSFTADMSNMFRGQATMVSTQDLLIKPA